MRTRKMNIYLNTKIIVGTILGLENNRKVVVHHISTGIKHHVHQGRLPFVDQPIHHPPFCYFLSIIAHCLLTSPKWQYQQVVVRLQDMEECEKHYTKYWIYCGPQLGKQVLFGYYS